MAPESFTLRVHRTDEEIRSLRDAWERLATAAHEATVFQTFEWLYPWFASYGAASVELVSLWDGPSLVGLVPLEERRARTLGVPLRTLHSWSNVHTPRFDLILERGREEAITEAWLETLARRRGWDRVQLDSVRESSGTAERLARLAPRHHLWFRRASQARSPFLMLTRDWGPYYEERPKKFRQNLVFAERGLKAAGEIRLRQITGGPELEPGLDHAFAIEHASWKGAAGTSILSSDRDRRFYEKVARLNAERDRFTLYLLELDGEAIAFDYCLRLGRTFNLVKTGYDPDPWAKHSPGSILRKRILQELHAGAEYDRYEMLGTDSPWKMKWTDRLVSLERLFLYNRTPGGRIAFLRDFGAPELAKRALAIGRRAAGRPATSRAGPAASSREGE